MNNFLEWNYWVFTSGEEGEHGLGWCVKFASPSLLNLKISARKDLDVKYRALLKDFNLPPIVCQNLKTAQV